MTIQNTNISAVFGDEHLKALDKIKQLNTGRNLLAHTVVYGCQQNEADMERIKGMLQSAG